MDGSDSQRLALARGRAADLLAHLFRSGVTVERLAHLRSVHALRPHLPEALDSAAADEAAARHHRATSRQVFPYESVFLDASALLGGDTAAALRDLGARSGRPLGQGEHEADHLSEELQLLSWLCAAEVHALEDGASNALARVRARQHELLDGHLLRWLPALAVALEPVDPLYGAAAELARELAVELHGELVQHGLSEGASAWSLPPADDLLSDPRVGLKAISKRLVTPVLVGGFWSQQRLAELARETGVGAGFGQRWQVLEVVLSGAAQQDRWEAACAGLMAEVDRWEAGWRRATRSSTEAITGPWLDRVAQTRALVDRLARRDPRPAEAP